MKQIAIAASLALCALTAEADAFKSMEETAAVSGTYRSTAPEPWYGGYGVREFIFKEGRWSMIFTHAMDPEMVHRTFQYRAGGAFDLLAASPDVDGAFQGRFGYDWKHVTRLTDNAELARAYGLAACDLPLNLEADISDTGCGNWRPVAECDADYDLFAMDEAGIYFGERAADNNQCTADRTPKALLPLVARYGS